MVDFENLAARPEPFFKQAPASSYNRESHKGGEAWFANGDVGQYVRTETNDGRKEHVLADLKGPGTITRFWSANPTTGRTSRGSTSTARRKPRLEVPLADLFNGKTPPFGPVFSYISGTGGNLYFPLPYAASLKITVEEKDKPVRLYYEIGYRTYPAGDSGRDVRPGQGARLGRRASPDRESAGQPEAAAAPGRRRVAERSPDDRSPGRRPLCPKCRRKGRLRVVGPRARDARKPGLGRSRAGPQRLSLPRSSTSSSTAKERSEAPLGDFFGSGPGVNPYENLFFTVDGTGRMTSRLLMPFAKSMDLRLTNAARSPTPWSCFCASAPAASRIAAITCAPNGGR